MWRIWRRRRRWRLRRLPGGLLVATSNSGKVFRLGDAVAKDATYTSEVFDAQGFSQWGRVEVEAAESGWGGVVCAERECGEPADGMERMGSRGHGRSGDGSGGAVCAVEGGAGAQKAELEKVGLNYLPKNVAPVVDEIVVQAGARVAASAAAAPNNTVQIAFPPAAGAVQPMVFSTDTTPAPLSAQKDRTAITVRWLAHDDNGDDLMFAVWYRGSGETNWRLLKDKISERFYSFDSALLPDGAYEVKVVASDAPMHTDADALTGEKVSGEFVVDTTPPVPGTLTAEMVAATPAKIHVRFEARDATSPISHAEYSVDAGPWQYVEPVGKVSDSLTERYDFLAAVPNATTPVTDVREHVIAMRVYDRFENAATVKAVVR